jgi:hypothetical protein
MGARGVPLRSGASMAVTAGERGEKTMGGQSRYAF